MTRARILAVALVRVGVLAGILGLGVGGRPATAVAQAVAPEDAVELLQGARSALRSGDLEGGIRLLEAVDSLSNGYPIVLRALLVAYARQGNRPAVLRVLRRIAPIGLVRPLVEDETFQILEDDSTFRALARQAAAAARPLVRGDTAFVHGDPDLLPEAVAFDPTTDAFLLGSLSGNRVVRVRRTGASEPFASVGAPGRIIGLELDRDRRLLWAASERSRDTDRPDRLLAWDLSSGVLVREVPVPADGGPHLLNDIEVAADGTVYVTDTQAHAVWRLGPGQDTLDLFHEGDQSVHWPNGIAISPSGRALYVAHMEGISVLDPRSGRRLRLDHPAGVATAEVDGLYACDGFLLGIQRVTDFQQVVRYELSQAGRRIVGSEVLERRHPAYMDPTTGVVVGDTLFYIANSQFSRRRPDGTLVPGPRPHGTVVLKLPLDRPCRAGGR